MKINHSQFFISNDNESKVHASVRFLMEHRQLEQRLRLDIPTLADPTIRDLLHESDLFVRSFNGLGFGFGLFSPFDLIRVLSSLAEVASQLYVLYSTTQGSLPFLTSSPSSATSRDEPSTRLHAPLLAILILPTLFSLLGSLLPSFPLSLDSPYALSSDSGYYSQNYAHVSERAERMRSLAHGEPFRAEVALFGLGPWILDSWASARKRILGLEEADASPISGILKSETGVGSLIVALRWLLTQSNASEMIVLLQNVSNPRNPHIISKPIHSDFNNAYFPAPLLIIRLVYFTGFTGPLPGVPSICGIYHAVSRGVLRACVSKCIFHGRFLRGDDG